MHEHQRRPGSDAPVRHLGVTDILILRLSFEDAADGTRYFTGSVDRSQRGITNNPVSEW